MRFISLWIISLVINLTGFGWSASHCIQSNASTGGDGSDWNNALQSFPRTLVRGDTYYVADGFYSDCRFDTPNENQEYIIIKKATISDHGPETGWSNLFADSQSVFYPMTFRSDYWVFDGINGSGKDGSSYGFRVQYPPGEVSGTLIGFGGFPDYNVNYVKIRHTDMETAGSAHNTSQVCINNAPRNSTNTSNVIVANNYMRGAYCALVIRTWVDCVIEHNYFKDTWSTPEHHGEPIAAGYTENITIRYNITENCSGTGIFIFGKAGTGIYGCCSNGKIYGNVHIGGYVSGGYRVGGGPCEMNNFEVYNNTFVNINSQGYGCGVYAGAGTGTIVYNNLWWNSFLPKIYSMTEGDISHDYNAFFGSSIDNDISEAHIQEEDIDPFVDSGNENFHLNISTHQGISIQYPYNQDPDGIVRGEDGVWDRGAFEYMDTGNLPTPKISISGISL